MDTDPALNPDDAPPGHLERCPVCRYDLRGLPVEYRCPECGFSYDARTRVWPAPSFGRFAGGSTAVSLLGVLCWAVAWLRGSLQGTGFWILTIMVIPAGFIGFGNLLLFRYKPFAAITPDGIKVREHWFMVRSIPWSEVGEVRRTVKVGAGRLVIIDRDRRPLTTLGNWFDDDDAEAFIMAARERQTEHRR